MRNWILIAVSGVVAGTVLIAGCRDQEQAILPDSQTETVTVPPWHAPSQMSYALALPHPVGGCDTRQVVLPQQPDVRAHVSEADVDESSPRPLADVLTDAPAEPLAAPAEVLLAARTTRSAPPRTELTRPVRPPPEVSLTGPELAPIYTESAAEAPSVRPMAEVLISLSEPDRTRPEQIAPGPEIGWADETAPPPEPELAALN